uniref:Uncharacterized protein n=1 Tax=Molossus molossus TaxID=27622 RepID=A0A7J8FTM6_MOLMO|nr:hypothetical protein HJG59_008376 [Molossus molossus]
MYSSSDISVLRNVESSDKGVTLPALLKTPIGLDIANFVHTTCTKTIAICCQRLGGHQTSAEPCSAGRAGAQIPRVQSGGTHVLVRMILELCFLGATCLYNHNLVGTTEGTQHSSDVPSVCSELATLAFPVLAMCKGDHIKDVPELLLVVDVQVEGYKKMKETVCVLRKLSLE